LIPDNGFPKSSRQKLESRLQKLQFDVDVMLRLFFAAARSTPLKTLKPRSTINSKHPLTNHTFKTSFRQYFYDIQSISRARQLLMPHSKIEAEQAQAVALVHLGASEAKKRGRSDPGSPWIHPFGPGSAWPHYIWLRPSGNLETKNLGLFKGNIDNGYTVAFKYTAANLKQSMTPRTLIGDWRETSGGQSPISSGFVFTDLGDASGRHQLVFASGDSIWQADLMLKRSVKMIIAATWNKNGVLKVFINGKEEASEVAQARFSAEYEIDPYPSIPIGYRNDEPETNKATVAIQDLAIWKKILSEAELNKYTRRNFLAEAAGWTVFVVVYLLAMALWGSPIIYIIYSILK